MTLVVVGRHFLRSSPLVTADDRLSWHGSGRRVREAPGGHRGARPYVRKL